MTPIKRVTKNTTTVLGNPYGDGRTDCCGAVTTYHDHDLCCAACYREVVHQDELVRTGEGVRAGLPTAALGGTITP